MFFLRRYRDSRCLVILNRGGQRALSVNGVEMPDGSYDCLLTGRKVEIAGGTLNISLKGMDALVLAVRGAACEARTIVHVQVHGIPAQPGERVAVAGDCPELGEWDLEHMQYLECINDQTWFGEVVFNETAGKPVAYKYVVLKPETVDAARRENRTPRRREIPEDGAGKWRDRWER